MSDVITEDRVSKRILSFTEDEFLYTGTVCQSWYKNSRTKLTHINQSLENITRLDEAYKNSNDSQGALEYAVYYGKGIDILGNLYDFGGVQIDYELATVAAERGHVHILEFLMKMDYFKMGDEIDHETLNTAIKHNQEDVVKFLLANGCYQDEVKSIELAVVNKNVKILKMMMNAGCSLHGGSFETFVDLNDYGSLEFMLQHYITDEHKKELGMCSYYEPDLEMMRFLLNNGFIAKQCDIRFIIDEGYLDFAKYIVKKYNIRMTEHLCYQMCSLPIEKHVETLNWLFHDTKCSIGYETFEDMEKANKFFFLVQKYGPGRDKLVQGKAWLIFWLRRLMTS